MDQEYLDKVREQLSTEKENVQKQLAVVADLDTGDHVPGKYAPKFPNYGDDHYTELEDNSPTEVADYSTNIDVTRNLETRLDSIEKALEKLDAGTYGICEKCDDAISEQRLETNPAAGLCIECARQT